MIEQELINIWKSSSKQEQIKFEKIKLLTELQSNMDRFEKSVKYRDLRELIPAIFMIPFFSYIAYTIPFLMSKIGAIILVVWCIYLIIRIKKLKKYKPITPAESFLNYLMKTKEYLIVQKRLLETVLYWYILPCCTGILLFFIGFNIGLEKKFLFIIGTIFFGIIIYFLNMNAVKNEFHPRLHKIDTIIQNINE